MNKHLGYGVTLFALTMMALPHSSEAKQLFGTGFERDNLTEKGWELDGLWNRITNPEEIAVHEKINPDLVELPDREGKLPAAKAGISALWYGDPENGTFISPADLDDQTEGNGGWSSEKHEGSATTPEIDLTNADEARLHFDSIWEIEGVDVDRYDVMTVEVTTDRGGTWTEIRQENPVDDADGESFKPYSSGGLGEVMEWQKITVDLADYVGETIQIRFRFQTVDERYNGFRSWMIDNVRVENKAPKRPGTVGIVRGAKEYCGGLINGEVTDPIHFVVHDEQRVVIRSTRAKWFMTPYGKDTRIKVKSKKRGTAYLNDGTYTLWVNRSTSKDCPKGLGATASVEILPGTSSTSVHKGAIVYLHSKNLVAGSTVELKKSNDDNGKKISVSTLRVVDSNRIQLMVPNISSEGYYDATITTPGGKTRTLRRVFNFVKDKAPTITSISPKNVSDDETTELTITGTHFTDGAVVTIGGLPLLDVTVNRRNITGTLPQGGAPGFQNVVVMNENGQMGKKIGALRIQDKSKTGYKPAGDLTVVPGQVKNVVMSNVAKKSATVSWDAVNNTTIDHYTVTVKHGKETVDAIETSELTTDLSGLTSGEEYTITVRAIGTYRGGMLSAKKMLTTE